MKLTDKIAVVTGASSGLGRAFSEIFIDKGASVYGIARNEDKLNKLHEEFGNRFQPVALDVTDHSAIEQWVDERFTDEHSPDVLVNNAGLGLFGDVDELPLEEWHAMMDTNVSGIFYMCRQIVPLMKANENICHIVNIASIAGKVGNPKMTGYNASKFAVRGFSESLFQEIRYDGIKVSCFFPGSVNTHFFDNVDGADTHPNMMQPRDIAVTLAGVIETPDNLLINEVVMRPLNPKPPEEQ
jgi:NADP-dependent 3-hydroxy acid dehydrogenase YdfG